MSTNIVTLTCKEILDLAELAGFTVDATGVELETELTIAHCPENGIEDRDGDFVDRTTYNLVAYITDYPDEGSIGLGDPLSTERVSFTEGGGT